MSWHISAAGSWTCSRSCSTGCKSAVRSSNASASSEEVRSFDQNVTALREKIRRLEIDIEAARLSIEVAVAGSADRAIGLVAQRGAA
jgi:hypothetical protein